jgi:hypothetical protein
MVFSSTITPLTDDELSDPVVQGRIAELNLAITAKIGDMLKDAEIDKELLAAIPEVPDDVFLPDPGDEPAEGDAVMPKADDYTPEVFDKYLTAEVLSPRNMGTIAKAKVTGGKRDWEASQQRSQCSTPENMKSSS